MDEPLPCRCGDPACVEVHDNHYWIYCSGQTWKHDMYDYPEVGGSDGYETCEEAVRAWNDLMAPARKGERK